MKSNLLNKSEILSLSAEVLHNNSLYSAVAHCAYYSCYQRMKHIWLYSMKNTEGELDVQCSMSRMGSHEYLFKAVLHYMSNTNKKDSFSDVRVLRNSVPLLKRMRIIADYSDTLVDSSRSKCSINLSKIIIPILKKY